MTDIILLISALILIVAILTTLNLISKFFQVHQKIIDVIDFSMFLIPSLFWVYFIIYIN